MNCGGIQHITDSTAQTAQGALSAAYLDASSRPFSVIGAGLGATTVTPGVWSSTSGLDITGTVTLDGTGFTNGGVFIFQTAGLLTTAVSSNVLLIGGAQAKNVFWQVGGAYASLGATSTFNGTIMCYGYVALGNLAVMNGRAMSSSSYVAMDNNTITLP